MEKLNLADTRRIEVLNLIERHLTSVVEQIKENTTLKTSCTHSTNRFETPDGVENICSKCYGKIDTQLIDIGCGHGHFLRRCLNSRQFAKVVGIDIDQESLNAAKG